MPAIKVQATKEGWYGGRYRVKDEVFHLVDEKNALTGEIVQKAEHSFAEAGRIKGGWMKRVVVEASLTPEEQISREATEAQAKADFEAARFSGLDADAPERVAQAHGAELGKGSKSGMASKASQTDAAKNGKGDVL
jgi:hypothetical protein